MDLKIIKNWLEMSMDNTIYPEDDYLEVGTMRTNRYLKEVREYAKQEELPLTEEGLWQAAHEELRDDFSNCGGVMMNRWLDLHCLYHHLPTQRKTIINYLLDLAVVEFQMVEI